MARLLYLGGVGFAVAVILLLDGPRTPGAPPAAASPAVVLASPAATPAAAEVAPRRGEADRPSGRSAWLQLPDGSVVPALNGAIAPPPLVHAWGDRPWSPIVGIEHSPAGIEWYVHADGARSTTEMRWRLDLGRPDALTRLALPVDGTPRVAER